MAHSEDLTNMQYQYDNIQELLITQLNQQFPGHFSIPIHVLSVIDKDVECEFEQLLKQESKDHTGERILLILYHLKNSHWIGMVIEFQVNGQIQRAEYIDPLKGSDVIPDRLQSGFTKIYPDIIIQKKDLLKTDDPRFSATLTIKNLLATVESNNQTKKIEDNLLANETIPIDGNEYKLCELNETIQDKIIEHADRSKLHKLEEKLRNGLAKFKLKDTIALVKEIEDTEKQIERLERQGREDMIRNEIEFLNELKELSKLSNQIQSLSNTLATDLVEIDKKNLYLKNLREDLKIIPICAEKTIIELLLYFEESTIATLQENNFVIVTLQNLENQLKREELFSETNRTILQNLKINITSNNVSSTKNYLIELLRQIRYLNISEIQRLVVKAKEAAELIRGKDIILLVGEAGAGKSTTIQFLAGSTMKDTQVEIAPGKFLQHIDVVEPVKNSQLNNIKGSPFHKPETRYITPVTVQLRDIFGAYETGDITLCDAPGFGDTAGPEVDIANCIGVIEALKETNSVKLLVLSSYKNLGDKGQGIQKLVHILINMVQEIENKLDAIFYAFTKFPEVENINALLTSIQNCKLKEDPSLRTNTGFVALLNDMIKKTEEAAHKINPVRDDPKDLIRKLKRIKSIKFPGEVFQFSITKQTQFSITNHVQKDKFGIISAMKHKDYNLIMYYLNDLKILKDLTKENNIQEIYEDSIRFVNENISEYCTEIMKKFNRLLISKDGLKENDIFDYKTFVEYLKQAQILKEHLGSSLLSPETLTQNIISKLQEMSNNLNDEDLHSPLVRIYFNNVQMLKNSFNELDMYYDNSCKEFEKRFDELIKSACEFILTNDFNNFAEICVKIVICLPLLKNCIGEQIEDKYQNIMMLFLRHLNSFTKEADSLLVKIRLTDSDIEVLKNYIEILKSAKQNSVLQDYVSTYVETLKKINDTSQIPKDLNEIYEEFISKIIEYFDNIVTKINELFKTNRECVLEDIERLVNDLDIIRQIPECESKIAERYHRLAENIREYMQQLQTTVKEQINCLHQQVNTVNYKQLARLITQLKNAEWINRFSSGTYNTIMHCITDDLEEYTQQLENRLKKLDLSLKCPENISISLEIITKIESISILERNIPELEKYRINIIQQFQQRVEEVFNDILQDFNLETRTITHIKLELNKLEEIRREYTSITDSSEAIRFLREKKLNSLELLNEAIQIKETIIIEREKVKQKYDFSERLDNRKANNALNYLSQCEKISYAREIAIDNNEKLKKYLYEYGYFLDQEINRKYKYICNNIHENISQDCEDLKRYLQELLSINEYSDVLKCFNGIEMIEKWRQKFLDFYRILVVKLDEYKCFGKYKELRDQLTIVQTLTCVDRFCNISFGALYTQNRLELIRALKDAYKKVLDYISKKDYANADIILHDIDLSLLNPKDIYQMKHHLKTSLNQLMENAKRIPIWLNRKQDNQNELKEMKDIIDKIRIALNKNNIMNLLDDEIQNNLRQFDHDIDESLSEYLLKGFSSIEVYIDTDYFLEAEQGLENLMRIQRDLSDYCLLNSVNKKSEELKKRLDNIVNEILKREDFSDINKYSINPPKDLLDKLKILVNSYPKYNQVYISLLTNIKQKFSIEIEKTRMVPLNERYSKIRLLNSALCFLSEELQNYFTLQIDELNKLIVDEEIANTNDWDLSFPQANNDDRVITKIKQLAERYKKENMPECFEILREQTIADLKKYQTTVQNSLDTKNIPSALDIVKKIFKYKELISIYFPEIEQICNNICLLIDKDFLNICEVFANISSTEQIDIVEKAFDNLVVYLNFSDIFFSENVLHNARERLEKFLEYVKINFKKYDIALSELNFVELYETMMIAKKLDNILQKIKQCSVKYDLLQILSKENLSYTDMSFRLEETINELINQLDITIVEYDDDKYRKEFEEDLYKNSMKIIKILEIRNSNFKDILSSDKFEEKLTNKIENITNKLITNASITELLLQDSDYFSICYKSLLLFEKDNYLNIFKENLFKRITFLYEQIVNSVLDIVKIAKLLIKLQYFSEKLSIFDYKIDLVIEEILYIFKEHQNNLQIKQLTTILDRSDIGKRLINKYSYLNGEYWKKIQKRVQNQNNISYVLENLYGDNVDIGVCYKDFGKVYKTLMSSILRSFKLQSGNEPDLESLITQAKKIAVVITPNSNLITWDYSIVDKIIELIAHLFVIWIFKNIKYYTTTCSYLLIPHVTQVIAVFRLMGIGYDTQIRMPNSKLLVNNLIEIGTGEGKSVVLGITACVFALTGVDVNCSCYSDVLSTRDKSDFTSVFRALGIEDRIEYGTFNKLCEQLLNEQCNVRETVRDMIINNKSSLSATDTSARIRPKILLIDEVDVFLSDKYYGRMYTSAVYLKSPSIKALLDSIWQNKTLNSVKALPAYQTCATQYSNWIYLFDEAIKDMIAALKSYQSSTYIVQNDKIVYVDGESIVDNVVRGYDTIWAYYHENQMGNISQSSLDDNVGIIINCGTFSYAEILHNFAYIAGVTGTLETLSEQEKYILKTAYTVHRNTFIPSIFGKSNRTFNSASDVCVVEMSVYFRKIREEIDVICNTGRAILVFFESAEKLMKFYNSSELSALKQNVQIITEETSVKEREMCIERATKIGRVTLLTRTFSRGIDFVCHDQKLLANGGIHVLQTFFSEELSEEYQIMKRGARQGDEGSYRMILLDRDLEWILGSTWKNELSKILAFKIYEVLNKTRRSRCEKNCVVKSSNVEQNRRAHQCSIDFIGALRTGNIQIIKNYLSELNQGTYSMRPIHTQFC